MNKDKPVDYWLLPDGVDELLPPQAERLESLRRDLLDHYWGWGYDLVITPLVEYLDSLLISGSHELDLATCKITDQLTGRMMGVRADITPQVARIDAHALEASGQVRLCYAGSVLQSRPEDVSGSRTPVQVGAELYGEATSAGDLEIVGLMIESLKVANVPRISLDLGHVGIFRKLTAAAGLQEDQEQALFALMQRKAMPEIRDFVQVVADPSLREMLYELPRLHGDFAALDDAAKVLAAAPDGVTAALEELRALGAALLARHADLELCFDLSELRGYHYHTGVVFAAYLQGESEAVAKGGRYDDIGAVFGRARPATGFSANLRRLAEFRPLPQPVPSIHAPLDGDAQLGELVARLRAAGERVVFSAVADLPAATRRLENIKGQWQLIESGNQEAH